MTSNNKTVLIIVSVVGGFLLLSCCGVAVLIGLLVPAVQRTREAADRMVKANELQAIGLAINMYYDQNKRMPAKVEDIQPFVGGPMGMAKLSSGEIEVIWNAVSAKDDDRGAGTVIMGWYTSPTADGQRIVMMLDGSTRTISENEFKNAPKARTVEVKK